MKPIQVGLLGIGTVGSGTFNVLRRNQEEIRRRAGRGIEIHSVFARNVERARKAVGDGVKVVTALTTDPRFTPPDEKARGDIPGGPYILVAATSGNNVGVIFHR